jgi:acyl carrier protein
MLPQHYVPLQTLPLLPNGKIDRHALPAPLSGPRARREVRGADRTPAEAALAGVWGEVLGMDPDEIDPSDNFFDLGGDSLKAGRTVIHFERSSGVRLETQRLIFETLAQMARGIALSDAQAPAPERAGDSWLKRLFKRLP